MNTKFETIVFTIACVICFGLMCECTRHMHDNTTRAEIEKINPSHK